MRTMSSLAFAAALALGAGSGGLRAETARVYFIEPTDGAVVASPFPVKFGLEGLALKPAGDESPDSGHHHLIVDGKPVAKGDVIEKSDASLHFGKAQTETEIKLPPGKHTLTLQFGDGGHLSYGPPLSATITVEVKP